MSDSDKMAALQASAVDQAGFALKTPASVLLFFFPQNFPRSD